MMKDPSVFTKEGKAFTTSRDIASVFGRRHDNVLRDVDRLIAQEREWGLLNFEETPYVDPQNGQTYRSVDITRDGFSVLVMGFTGADALRWKLRYIEAFNLMDAELRQRLEHHYADLGRGYFRIRIGAREVLADASTFQIGPRDEAVVCGHDGQIKILRGPLDLSPMYGQLGRRSVAGPWRKSKIKGALRERDYYTVLGRVLRPDEKPRGAKTVRVRSYLRSAPAGSNALPQPAGDVLH